MKYQSEKTGGWAAALRFRKSGPAVHVISPMGLLACKAWLIRYTCATSCLSHCPALCSAGSGCVGKEGACVCICPLGECVRAAGEHFCYLMNFQSVYSVSGTSYC